MEEKKRRRLPPVVWVNSTYFAEGFPFIVVRFMSTLFFTDMGAKEAFLGYLNFLGIPWNFKFLWAPFVDIIATKRRWLITIEMLITMMILAIAVLVSGVTPMSAADAAAAMPSIFYVIVYAFIALAFLSCTHDIAIDGYYLEAITDKAEQAEYTGQRVLSYRVAIIYVKSLLVIIAAKIGWDYGFGIGAATMGVVTLFHFLLLPKVEAPKARKPAKEALVQFGRSFATYLEQDRVWVMLLFIIMYRLGDELLLSMSTPFLMRELAVTKPQMAWLGSFVAAGATVAGAMIGSRWISKVGLKKAIWPLTLLMNLNMWAYIALAYFRPQATESTGLLIIALTHGYEMMAAGLGNAVIMVYLMRTCKPEYKAGHFAVGSALMSLGGIMLGGFAGKIVEGYGYVNLYLISFVLAALAMPLIFFIPHLDNRHLKQPPPQNAPGV